MPSFLIEPDILYSYGHLETFPQETKINIDSFLRENCDFWYPGDSHAIFWLANSNGEVLSMLTATESTIDNKQIIEIYNVCASTTHRRKGYTKKLLELIIYQYPNIPLWLAVIFGNTSAFRLYTSLGFSYPEVTKTPPSGGQYDDYVISLIYNGDITNVDKVLTMDYIKLIHQKFNKKLDK